MGRLQQPMEDAAIGPPVHDQGIEAPLAPGAADKKGQHAASQDERKALLAKAHPLRGEEKVQRHDKPHE